MTTPIQTRSREEWRKAREQGMGRFVLIGALRRGIPMALLVIVGLELFEGGTFTSARLQSAAFLERVLFVFSVFLAGGALSTFARWKAYESIHGDGSST